LRLQNHAHALRKSIGQLRGDPSFAAQTAVHIAPHQADPFEARGLSQSQNALHLSLSFWRLDAAFVGKSDGG
jgi:hypothetical protein